MATNFRRLTNRALCLIWSCTLVCAAGGVFAADSLCITTVGGLEGKPNVTDGIVDGDVGWNNAVKVNLGANMGVSAQGTLQIGRDASNLYIALEMQGFPTADVNDTIVLAFSTDGNVQHDWRLQVTPFPAGFINDTVYSASVQYWRNSSTWNTTNPGGATPTYWYADGPSITGFGEFHSRAHGSTWSMEMRIPTSNLAGDATGLSKLFIPASPANFHFYFNALSTNTIMGSVNQVPWPAIAPVGPGPGFLANLTPAPAAWGYTTLNTSDPLCTGLSLQASDVGVRQTSVANSPLGYTTKLSPIPMDGTTTPPTFHDDMNNAASSVAQCKSFADNDQWPAVRSQENYYVARPHNTGPDANVWAQFYIAPWGITPPSTNWDKIGELALPAGAPHVYATPSAVVAASSSAELQTDAWQLSNKQACLYMTTGWGTGHHCIQAELFSSNASTVFLNKSVQINHNFVTASVADMAPTISVAGSRPNPRCSRADRAVKKCEQEVLLVVNKNIQKYRRTKDGNFYLATAYLEQPVIEGGPGAALPANAVGSVTAQNKIVGLRPGMMPLLANGALEPPKQFREFAKIPAQAFPKGVDEAMTEITRGYLKTGNFLIINGHRFEEAQYLGGYSYTAGHAGTVQSWNDSLSHPKDAAKLKDLGNGVYSLKVPEGESVQLAARVEAKETPQVVPCHCGLCAKTAAFEPANGNKLAGTEFLWFGMAGVGAVAFTRRRRDKSNKEQ